MVIRRCAVAGALLACACNTDTFARTDAGEGGVDGAADAGILFADDFEGAGAFPPGKWSSFLTSGGSLGLVADGGADGSTAARFGLAAGDAGAVFFGPRLAVEMPAADHVRCAFSASLEQGPSTPGRLTLLAQLEATPAVGTGIKAWRARWRYGASQTSLFENVEFTDGGTLNNGPAVAHLLKVAEWHRYRIEVERAVGLTIGIDGSESKGTTVFPSNTKLTLTLQLIETDPPAPMVFRYDDVVCEAL